MLQTLITWKLCAVVLLVFESEVVDQTLIGIQLKGGPIQTQHVPVSGMVPCRKS